ncbi:hypothetical protein NXW78_22810 [Bacteroides ovatus]|nr:hypothetical protein [Bacteroides ovatus]
MAAEADERCCQRGHQTADHCTVKALMQLYRFRTMGELRALLSLYNIGVEEVAEGKRWTTYHGILYTALDGNGERAWRPL